MKLVSHSLTEDFPVLTTQTRPLVYLDSAATALTPNTVVDALVDYYTRCSANVHRGVHELSMQASRAYEDARTAVASFFNIPGGGNIVFTSGTTNSINMAAYSLASKLSPGDNILLTIMEHHSNFLPWVAAGKKHSCRLLYVPILEDGTLDYKVLYSSLEQYRPKIFALCGMSNVTGYMPDIPSIVQAAHAVGSIVVIDGAQLASHQAVDMEVLNCDVFCCSGHKLYGPTGIGMLYAKPELLEEFVPMCYGGGMVQRVSLEGYTLAKLPERLEGGTPHIAGAIGFHAAVDYLSSIGMKHIAEHEYDLSLYLVEQLHQLPYVRILGHNEYCTAICSFVIDGVHAHDAGSMLDSLGIAVRVGHHCAQPLINQWKITSTIRASFGMYNSREDVDVLVEGIKRLYSALG